MTARLRAPVRRQAIADAALEVIADRGVAGFTAAAVAARVGTTDAALFHHFRSKADIVVVALSRVEELIFADFPPIAADPLARLALFFRQRVAVMQRHPGIARLLTSDHLAQLAGPEGAESARQLPARSRGFVIACLEEAAAAGSLADGVGPIDAAVLVLGSLMALTQVAGFPVESAISPDVAERVWADLERLFRSHPPPVPSPKEWSPK